MRAIELNTPQRCALHISSRTDIEESFGVGGAAVAAAAKGASGVMAAYIREADEPYSVRYEMLPVSEIANCVKAVPREYINERGNGITADGIRYLKPLIEGEVFPVFENGIPKHFIMPEQK